MNPPAVPPHAPASPAPDFVGWQVRPATHADLPALAALLPLTADLRLPAAGDGECWLVAAPPQGGPQACLRLRPVIGRQPVRYWYHVGCAVHAAPSLNLFHRQRTLLLGNDHTGACELADIAWDTRPARPGQAALLRLLIRAVLLRVARQRAAFGPELIVELPGLRDAAGQSPFWQGLGRHFYAGDPLHAARRLGPGWRSHVAMLLPRQPVHVAFLPEAAQAALGQVPASAQVLAQVLAAEGLRDSAHVRIDDGGPVLSAPLAELRAVQQAREPQSGPAAVAGPLLVAEPDGTVRLWPAGPAPAGWWLPG